MNKEEIRRLPRDERIDFLRRQYFTGVMRTFVEGHPRPDKPALSWGREYSPSDLLRAVEEGTDIGKKLTKHMFESSKEYGESVSALVNGKADTQNKT